METPKEIYVHIRKEPRPSITFSEVEEKNCENIKYIRADLAVEKEKLVAYLERRRKTIVTSSGFSNYAATKVEMLNELIRELKTL